MRTGWRLGGWYVWLKACAPCPVIRPAFTSSQIAHYQHMVSRCAPTWSERVLSKCLGHLAAHCSHAQGNLSSYIAQDAHCAMLLHIAQCNWHIVHYKWYIVHCKLYNVHVYSELYVARWILSIAHFHEAPYQCPWQLFVIHCHTLHCTQWSHIQGRLILPWRIPPPSN